MITACYPEYRSEFRELWTYFELRVTLIKSTACF